MPITKHALILAGGQGIRLGPRGKRIPKGFIEIGGRTLIERSLHLLFDAGIEQVSIVTGHLDQFYKELAERYSGRIDCILNDQYSSRGSLESLRTGLAAVAKPCLLLESDLIYEFRALQTLIAHNAENAILVSGPTGAGDEVYVWTDPKGGENRFCYMSKRLEDRSDRPLGELVGICRVNGDLRAELLQHAETAPASADYESGMVTVSSQVPTTCVKVEDLLWGEIDDTAMLDRVKNVLWRKLAE